MRTLSYANLHRDRSHECENLVLVCIDFRFHKEITDLLRYAGYREFDLLGLPGGSKAVTDEATRGVVFKALDIVIPAHKCKRVIVVDHIDCRAYGGSEAFTSPAEEEVAHAEDLRAASEIIREKYGSLEVITCYADWSGVKVIEGG